MPIHNKSGYEIRLELLQMAMGLVNDQYHTTLDNQRMHAEKTGLTVFEVPSDDRVANAITIATELYGFVGTK
jgi:hypothetical protein